MAGERELTESNAITPNRLSAEVNEYRRQLLQLTVASPPTQLIFNERLTDGCTCSEILGNALGGARARPRTLTNTHTQPLILF